MPKARPPDADEAARVGLCVTCRHAAHHEGTRGSLFWRCLRADEDPAYRRYPALPVQTCAGHRPHTRP